MINGKTDKQFTFIDLFAGIGGIRIAFERNGGKCVFSSELDEPCQDVYEKNFGERPAGDITKIASDDIPNHDILTGGFPCQTFSIIGNGAGFADTRGTLFFEIERILRDKQPYAFLLENVKQLASHDKGRTFKVIMSKLEELGYYTHWSILNGLDFGVPQKRERTIIVGFKQNHPFEFPKHGDSQLTLKDVLEPHEKVDKKYFASEHIRAKRQKRVNHVPHTPGIWHENKSGNIGIHPFSCALRANGSYNYLLVDGIRRPTPREMLRLQGYPDSFETADTYTQARKQAGNSVVIPKIEAVARAMLKSIALPPVKPAKQMPLMDDFDTAVGRHVYLTEA